MTNLLHPEKRFFAFEEIGLEYFQKLNFHHSTRIIFICILHLGKLVCGKFFEMQIHKFYKYYFKLKINFLMFEICFQVGLSKLKKENKTLYSTASQYPNVCITVLKYGYIQKNERIGCIRKYSRWCEQRPVLFVHKEQEFFLTRVLLNRHL